MKLLKCWIWDFDYAIIKLLANDSRYGRKNNYHKLGYFVEVAGLNYQILQSYGGTN